MPFHPEAAKAALVFAKVVAVKANRVIVFSP
jgi:hypothetical protein